MRAKSSAERLRRKRTHRACNAASSVKRQLNRRGPRLRAAPPTGLPRTSGSCRRIFGHRQLEPDIGVEVTVGEMVHDLAHGPSTPGGTGYRAARRRARPPRRAVRCRHRLDPVDAVAPLDRATRRRYGENSPIGKPQSSIGTRSSGSAIPRPSAPASPAHPPSRRTGCRRPPSRGWCPAPAPCRCRRG